MDFKNRRLAYNEFAYKKIKDDCKLKDRFQKKVISGSHMQEIADKKNAYNEGRLYTQFLICYKPSITLGIGRINVTLLKHV